MPPLLEIRNLHRWFGGLHATDDVSFTVAADSITAVIGPNGAGKTTLFNLIAGSLRPDAGEVIFQGAAITGWRPHRVAARGILRTFQQIRLFPKMTALENVMVGRHVRSHAGFLAGMASLPWTWQEEAAIRREAHKFLNLLEIEAHAASEAVSLPFGQQRAVEFARALAGEPVLLLLDEPASGLNLHETARIGQFITQIRELGITILIVEHDMSLVMSISDQIVVLDHGQKIAEGRPAAIQQNPEVIRVYLGDEEPAVSAAGPVRVEGGKE